MIQGTIKDYTITTLQHIICRLVIKKGYYEGPHRKSINLDLHTSQGLHISHIDTRFYNRFQDVECPIRSQVTYSTQVHPEDITKDLRHLTKPNLWEIAYILSEI